MKNFNRIAAMVLAAVLALSVLTACGQNLLGKEWIDAELAAINNVRDDDLPTLTNDPDLEALCNEALENLQDGVTRYGMDVLYKKLSAGDGYATHIIITYDKASQDKHDTRELTPLTMEYIENVSDQYNVSDREPYNGYKAVGFGYRVTSDGTIYMAEAYTLPSKWGPML